MFFASNFSYRPCAFVVLVVFVSYWSAEVAGLVGRVEDGFERITRCYRIGQERALGDFRVQISHEVHTVGEVVHRFVVEHGQGLGIVLVGSWLKVILWKNTTAVATCIGCVVTE